MASHKKSRSKARVAVKPDKGKPKKKAAVKAAKPKRKRQVIPRDQVPSSMAPPEMPDTRPVRPQANQTTPTAAERPATIPQTGSSSNSTTAASTSGPVAPPTPPGQSAVSQRQSSGRRLQGAACTWIGRESAAKDGLAGILTCPSCGEHVIESTQDDQLFWMGIDQYELGAYTSVNPPARPHPGYRAFMEWIIAQSELGRCWPSPLDAADEYEDETGIRVDPTR